MEIIAHIHTDFKEKFGIPRQSGLVEGLMGTIVFEPEYRNKDALRGIEEFSHLWILWQFSENIGKSWSPTVRPPRLGGNERVGVFATRSPFRPNPIGLSSVRLTGVEKHPEWGWVMRVVGVDMMDGTPIYDIKPYLPHIDSHPDALGSYSAAVSGYRLTVKGDLCFPDKLSRDKKNTLLEILANDPRPSYHNDPDRIYGMNFAGYEVRFVVADGVLTVVDIKEDET